MYLLNFNVNIAHGIQEGIAIGGGHFALLGGWDTDGHLVIADVNPKKYLRYWRCTPNRMFRAMQVRVLRLPSSFLCDSLLCVSGRCSILSVGLRSLRCSFLVSLRYSFSLSVPPAF